MSRDARILFGLLLFNALWAVGGGIALMAGVIPPQASWVAHTDFSGLYFPLVVCIFPAWFLWPLWVAAL